ncbi:syntaxin-71 isoform X4 [Physcomitrium patens]|uniref:syntaxin-71 isoform X4 n=1 Tax=Physcomitrium patens TaxID=3218 RepID=UPI000D179FCD|nr:syntaxin-71-like isoform X3 [Physcomitrium patens]|eukprot:XP_024379243.1 syntaxin-71-like isoform X3 [Physcomitrella patens]
MSTIDLLTRVNGVIKKYEKYDTDNIRGPEIASHDYFLRLYKSIEDDLNGALKKAAEAESEKNRAVIATLNADLRRTKAALRSELPKLHKLAAKKVKGVPPEEILTRPNMALALSARIEEVPDGVSVSKKKVAKGTPLEIKIDNYSPEDILRQGVKDHSVESKGFQEEFETRRKKQDEGFMAIEQGLNTLKDMAQDIGEELNKQEQLVDEADSKIDKAGSDLKSTNSRLKESLTAGTEEVTAWLVTNLQVLQHLVQQHHMDLLCSCLHVPSNPPRLSSHTPGVRI